MSFHSPTAERNQRGSVLIDVMLGMTIFSLLIVIGMKNYSTYQDRAALAVVNSDIQQVAAAIESWKTDNGIVPPGASSGVTYPGPVSATYINAGAGSSLTNLGALKAKLSPNVSIGRYGVYGVWDPDGPTGPLEGYNANTVFYLCLVHKDGEGKINAWSGWFSHYDRIYEQGKGTKPNTGSTACGPVVDVP